MFAPKKPIRHTSGSTPWWKPTEGNTRASQSAMTIGGEHRLRPVLPKETQQFQRALGNQTLLQHRPYQQEAPLTVSNRPVQTNRIMRLPAEPYVKKINVNLDTSQTVSLDWQGTPPSGVRSTFRCSTGKGYGDPDDPPGVCNRSCCNAGVNPCDPPFDQRRSRGSCCTPVGNFVIQHKDREHEVTGGTIPFWMYFYRTRGIAIHEYFPVDGTPISHGCVRLDSTNAEMLFNYSHANVTRVSVTGQATPACPTARDCSTSASTDPAASQGAGGQLASVGREETDQAV